MPIKGLIEENNNDYDNDAITIAQSLSGRRFAEAPRQVALRGDVYAAPDAVKMVCSEHPIFDTSAHLQLFLCKDRGPIPKERPPVQPARGRFSSELRRIVPWSTPLVGRGNQLSVSAYVPHVPFEAKVG
jgi:hypothetical protein